MTRQTGDFDNVARIYDRLAGLVFGRSIRDAQTCFLPKIENNSKILVLGGGTGWLLEEIGKLNVTVEVWYVEASSEMLKLSCQREVNFPVHFIHGTHEQIPPIAYDVVITHFFLDLFKDKELDQLITTVTLLCGPGSQWLVADFQYTGKWWQRTLLGLMYGFFRLTSSVSVGKLPHWEAAFRLTHWKREESAEWKSGFIRSVALHLNDIP